MSVATIEKTVAAPATPETVAEIDAVGAEVMNHYSLADALREGSTIVKQIRENYGSVESGQGCALTAVTAGLRMHGLI